MTIFQIIATFICLFNTLGSLPDFIDNFREDTADIHIKRMAGVCGLTWPQATVWCASIVLCLVSYLGVR